jgi:murein DD-endopeptidase MepM/ murein hydrolase activator NlpD
MVSISRPRLRRSIQGLVLLASMVAARVWGASLPVSIEVTSRELAPGEPVRIEVASPEPLRAVEAEFLGRPVFLVRTAGRADGGERWAGWSMIGLDDPPGVAAVEVHGASVGGRDLAGTRAVTVAPKRFPQEELAVAPKYVEPPENVRERLARERRMLAGIYETRRAAVPPEEPFVRPVSGEPTSIFGTRRVYNGQPRSPHPGLDLRAASGTPVRSSGPGLVVLARELYYSGNTVIVDHGGGLFTIYAHLSEFRVRELDTAEAGQVIGLSGATGRVTGPHLHWGAKIGNLPFDPTALLDPALFR